jgi:alpha-D-xyloside xylohydrolase
VPVRPTRLRAGLVIVGAASVLATAGAGSSRPAQPPLQTAVAAEPFQLDVLMDGKPLTTLGGEAAPFAFTTRAGGPHRLTSLRSTTRQGARTTYLVETDERGRTATVTTEPRADGLRIELRLRPATGVAAVRVGLAASPDDHFLGTGQRARWVDMRGAVVPLKTWNNCASNMPAPFFAGSSGFGAYFESDAVGRIAFPGAREDDPRSRCDLPTPGCDVGSPTAAVRVCLKTARLALVVVPGTMRDAVSAYSAYAGRPRRPWLPQLALIKWRDTIAGPQELFDDIEQMRRRKLPIGWVILDNPWEEGAFAGRCFGALTFDRQRYPDPKATIAEIRRRGVRLMLWISPQRKKRDCPFHPYPDGWLTGDGQHFVWDLTNPPARAEFVRKIRALVELGVEGFKGDRGDEVDLEGVRLAGGSGMLLHNTLPREYAQAVADAIRPVRGTRFATSFRTSAPGSSSLLPGFVGTDTPHTVDGLHLGIRMAQTAGVSGMPVWSVDTGGYQGGELTSEVFVRWAQFSALTPILNVGGAGPNARFWELGEPTVELFRRAATLHYELVPYLYELTGEASRTGIPVLRPLGLTWQDDERAWAADLQFTVGDALLAAPVTTVSRTGTDVGGPPDRSRVYLPRGAWIDVFDGSRHVGGRTIVRRSTLADFPLYVRAGAALPFNFRSPVLWRERWRPDDLLRPGRQGWLVGAGGEGGGVTVARQGATELTVRASRRPRGPLELELRRAARQQQVLVLGAGRICSVSSGGRPLPRRALAALPDATSGWAVEAAPRRGLVVKLRTAGSARVALLPCA